MAGTAAIIKNTAAAAPGNVAINLAVFTCAPIKSLPGMMAVPSG
jgi:hypothetical protein